MSWFCCGREKTIKKQKQASVYEKSKPISQLNTNLLYPTTVGQVQNTKDTPTADLQIIKNNLRRAAAQQIINNNDFIAVKEEQTKNDRYVMRKLLKSGYDHTQMALTFKDSTDKWTDPEFNYEEVKISGTQNAKWKRPEQFMQNPQLMPENLSPNDIIQGKLNDCYFLSAVACLAQKDYRIHNIFSTKTYNPNGYYVCKLTFNGIYQEVIVDDLFPVNANNRPLFAQPVQNKYIWVMVLEKCWAKLLKGYSNTNYGFTAEAFQTLNGAPTSTYLLREHRTPEDPKCSFLFDKLKESDEKGYCSQVTINTLNEELNKKWSSQYGLPTGHAYSLLGVYTVALTNGKTVRLLQVRNPWGTQESKLAWNDNDSLWKNVSPEEKERIQYRYNKNDHDGVFYMEWDTFADKFDHLFSISEINDNANYVYTSVVAQDRQPIYFEVETDGASEELSIIFAQEMQQHFKQGDQIQYACISVVVSKQGFNAQNQTTYDFIGGYNYYNKAVDNYFTLPYNHFPKGRYLLRVYVYWGATPCNRSTPLVAGIYSSAVIGLQQLVTTVHDEQFIQKNCISRAQQSSNRQPVPNDPNSWICKQIFPNTNLGYLVFSFSNKSDKQKCLLKFDQRNNKNLYFLGDHRGLTEFSIQCEKGYMYVVIYAYYVQFQAAMDKKIYPNYQPNFRPPTPQVVPI